MLLSSLFPDLVLMVPGCPEPTMERALREAARQFCRDTYVVTEYTDPTDTVAGEQVIELTGLLDSSLEVVAVLETVVDGAVVPPVPQALMRNASRAYAAAAPGAPRATYGLSERELLLWPTPDAVYTVQFLVATAPTAAATRIADDLGGRWKYALIGKAASILAIQPNQAYSSSGVATHGELQYRSEVGKARVELNRSFGRGTRVSTHAVAWP